MYEQLLTQAEIEKEKRKRLTESLMKSLEGMGDTQMVSGRAVPYSPWQGLGKLGEALLYKRGMSKSDAETDRILKDMQGEKETSINNVMSMYEGNSPSPDQEGIATGPSLPANPEKAAIMAASDPYTKDLSPIMTALMKQKGLENIANIKSDAIKSRNNNVLKNVKYVIKNPDGGDPIVTYGIFDTHAEDMGKAYRLANGEPVNMETILSVEDLGYVVPKSYRESQYGALGGQAGKGGIVDGQVPYGQPQAQPAPQAMPQGQPVSQPAPQGQPIPQSIAKPVPSEAQLAGRKTAAEQGVNSPLTPAQRKIDDTFATEWAEYKALGGKAEIDKNIEALEDVASRVIPEGLSKPGLTVVPDVVQQFLFSNSLDARQNVEEVVQKNLRAILGGQFAQKEGENLVARAYNEGAEPEQNAKRLNRLIEQIKRSAAIKEDAGKWLEEHGTLQGWNGELPKKTDFTNMFNDESTDENEVPEGIDPKVWDKIPNEKKALWR